MKKLLILLLIAVSCTKDKQAARFQCYVCTFGTLGNYTPPPKEICGQDPAEFIANFTDANGNKPGGSCKLK